MRVAVMVVVMFAVTTPLQASQSCMSKTEARKNFSSSHIYWHGPDHCWDATPARHHGIHGVRRNAPSREADRKRDRPEPDQSQLDDQSKPDQSKPDQSKPDQSRPNQSKSDQPKLDRFKWRDSMSAMLPDADQPLRAARDARADGAENAATGALPSDRDGNAAPSPIASRWVDIVQVAPPPVIEPKPEPSGTLNGVMLVLIAIVLTAGTVMVLFRFTVLRRPGSMTDV
jgi:hypothetical protein